jgi:hypothetical protein
LVFEEDVLPDWTKVAYYSCGQKLLVGSKKGFGIFAATQKVNLLLLGLMFCFNIIVAREGFYLHLQSRSAPSHVEAPVASRDCSMSYRVF